MCHFHSQKVIQAKQKFYLEHTSLSQPRVMTFKHKYKIITHGMCHGPQLVTRFHPPGITITTGGNFQLWFLSLFPLYLQGPSQGGDGLVSVQALLNWPPKNCQAGRRADICSVLTIVD